MADTGWKYPTVSSTGTFSNPGNAHANNNQTSDEDRNNESQTWKDFGFDFGTGLGTVQGIEVRLAASWEDSGSYDVQLSWDNGSTWSSIKNASQFGYSETIDTEGGAADDWGHTWTESELGSANFKVRLTKQGQDYVWMYLDYLQVRVHYTPVAPSVDNSSSGSGSDVSSKIVSHTTGTGNNRFMIVGVALTQSNGSTSVSSVTYGGQSLTKIGHKEQSGEARTEMWKLVNPASGTANVTVNLSALENGLVVGVTTFENVDQITPHGTYQSSGGDSGHPSLSVTSAEGELVIDAGAMKDSLGVSSGSGQTQRWNANSNGNQTGYGSTEPGATSVTMSWTAIDSGMNWALGAVSLKYDATAPSGWSGGNVNTVTSQGKVNGVDVGNISKINTV